MRVLPRRRAPPQGPSVELLNVGFRDDWSIMWPTDDNFSSGRRVPFLRYTEGVFRRSAP